MNTLLMADEMKCLNIQMLPCAPSLPVFHGLPRRLASLVYIYKATAKRRRIPLRTTQVNEARWMKCRIEECEKDKFSPADGDIIGISYE